MDLFSRIRDRFRDAVFGVQDGLVSTLGALTGVAEGSGDPRQVILAGLVVVAVEALSMGAGSYLSSKAQREYLERLLREEKEAIERNPEGERKELREMYGARGFTEAEVAVIERRLFADRALLLEDMAHKELGICPASLEDPAGNGLVMGAAYAVAGFVPLAPYFVLPLREAMLASAVAAFGTLFAVGAGKGRLVRRSWWRSGLEMVVVAGTAAAVGSCVGRAIKGF